MAGKLTPEQQEEVARRHAAGEQAAGLARWFKVSERTVYYWLKRPVREATTDMLAAMSPAALREAYWGASSGQPSLVQLARKLGCGRRRLSKAMKAAGVTIRTNSQQARVDYSSGRRKMAPMTPNRAANVIGKGRLLKFSRKQLSTFGKKGSAALWGDQGWTVKPCDWCAAPIERRRSRFRYERNYCCRSHHSHGLWHERRFGGDRPRPVIVTLLRDLMKHPNGIPIAFPTHEQMERAAATVGAREPEIEAVLLEMRG